MGEEWALKGQSTESQNERALADTGLAVLVEHRAPLAGRL